METKKMKWAVVAVTVITFLSYLIFFRIDVPEGLIKGRMFISEEKTSKLTVTDQQKDVIWLEDGTIWGHPSFSELDLKGKKILLYGANEFRYDGEFFEEQLYYKGEPVNHVVSDRSRVRLLTSTTDDSFLFGSFLIVMRNETESDIYHLLGCYQFVKK